MRSQNILKSIAKKTTEEFYTPIPEGYKIGKTKYVITFGTVMSGLGKGIFSSSLAKTLQDLGLRVSPIKVEGYLNLDSGTLNPFRHGEVFVLDDGMESDMDLGTYERMLSQNLIKDNFITTGQVYTAVLEKERKGTYLGRDVQIIPHLTAEIKNNLRNLAIKTKADVIFVEIGGTVGDFENSHHIEAIRELAYEEGKENVCFVALTYIIEPKILGEQKSKAAQLGIKKLMETGIQPDIIACRASTEVTQKIREKISVYTNIPVERVVSMHDLESIYLLPNALREEKLDKEVIKLLDLEKRINPKKQKQAIKQWNKFTQRIKYPKHKIKVGVTGKYTGLRDSYASIIKALEHAGALFHTKVDLIWIDTTTVTKDNVKEKLKGLSGIIVPGGFGKRGTEGKIECIRYVRENKLPYLGLCYGFQMAVIEFARNVCGLKGANSTEIEDTKHPVVDLLPEQKVLEGLGGNMRLGGREIDVKPNTMAYKLYGNKTKIRERFRHRYECNPEYILLLEEKGLIFSGKAPKFQIMQILEIKDHPFFVGTQFHPEFTSRPLNPNPLFRGFVEAALKLSSNS
jgi:CTP synthase